MTFWDLKKKKGQCNLLNINCARPLLEQVILKRADDVK